MSLSQRSVVRDSNQSVLPSGSMLPVYLPDCVFDSLGASQPGLCPLGAFVCVTHVVAATKMWLVLMLALRCYHAASWMSNRCPAAFLQSRFLATLAFLLTRRTLCTLRVRFLWTQLPAQLQPALLTRIELQTGMLALHTTPSWDAVLCTCTHGHPLLHPAATHYATYLPRALCCAASCVLSSNVVLTLLLPGPFALHTATSFCLGLCHNPFPSTLFSSFEPCSVHSAVLLLNRIQAHLLTTHGCQLLLTL